MSALVLGALSLLVLIVLATMWVAGGGDIFAGFAQIIGGTKPNDKATLRQSCELKCSTLKNSGSSLSVSEMKDEWCSVTGDIGGVLYYCGADDGDNTDGTAGLAVDCSAAASDGAFNGATAKCCGTAASPESC